MEFHTDCIWQYTPLLSIDMVRGLFGSQEHSFWVRGRAILIIYSDKFNTISSVYVTNIVRAW
jgi:hypothetical protein